VRFHVLSQIKPQVPLLVCSSVNSFKFQPCNHTPPKAHSNFYGIRSKSDKTKIKKIPLYEGHLLGMGLRRYLIIFDPPSFVLDQKEFRRWLLSLSFNLYGSPDFTPRHIVWPPPSIPFHCILNRLEFPFWR